MGVLWQVEEELGEQHMAARIDDLGVGGAGELLLFEEFLHVLVTQPNPLKGAAPYTQVAKRMNDGGTHVFKTTNTPHVQTSTDSNNGFERALPAGEYVRGVLGVTAVASVFKEVP